MTSDSAIAEVLLPLALADEPAVRLRGRALLSLLDQGAVSGFGFLAGIAAALTRRYQRPVTASARANPALLAIGGASASVIGTPARAISPKVSATPDADARSATIRLHRLPTSRKFPASVVKIARP